MRPCVRGDPEIWRVVLLGAARLSKQNLLNMKTTEDYPQITQVMADCKVPIARLHELEVLMSILCKFRAIGNAAIVQCFIGLVGADPDILAARHL